MSPIVNDGLSLGDDEYFEGLEEKLKGHTLPQAGPPEAPRQPEMHIDGGLTFREVQRRAERVQHRTPEISMANTLIELLGEVRHIRAALTALNEGTALFSGAAASRSSVQLEQGAKEVRLTVKLYADSPLGTLGDDTVAEFGRLFRLIEQRQMAGWAETVEAVRNRV